MSRPSGEEAAERGADASARPGALLVAALVLLLDQASKWVILAIMQPPRRIEVTGFFNLVLTYNRGVSFGLFAAEHAWRPYALAGLSLVIVAGLLYWLGGQAPRRLTVLAGGLVVGGALGNVIDRFVRPGVLDFLDLHLAGWHWPAFNVADSAIVIGVALIVLDGLFGARHAGK